MQKILILTRLGDIHSIYVSAGLESLGHLPVRWFGADLPLRDTITVCAGMSSNFHWSLKQPEKRQFGPFDTVWHRRRALPSLPEDKTSGLLHPHDREFTEYENETFATSLWDAIEPDAFWVNPMDCAKKANSKILQIRLASELGLAIPETCISNDPDDIKSFIACTDPAGAIYKPFGQGHWPTDDEGGAMLSTKAVTLDQLPADDVLRLTPGIFQYNVPKAYELRITIIGHSFASVRINSQSNEKARQDWRVVQPSALTYEVVNLPDAVEAKLLQLMDRLGIVFGCVDMIVTPDGEHVFLEVNEMGQIFWI